MRIYVAIPYTRHEKLSFEMANHASYELIQRKHIPLSPISMSHPIVEQSKIDGNYSKELHGTWEVWSTIDYAFIDWCDEVWVVEMTPELVEESVGVQAELKYAKELGKKVRTIKVDYIGEGADRNWKFTFPLVEENFKTNARIHAENIAEALSESLHTKLDMIETVEEILS